MGVLVLWKIGPVSNPCVILFQTIEKCSSFGDDKSSERMLEAAQAGRLCCSGAADSTSRLVINRQMGAESSTTSWFR